ncbi:type IV toxin-antitoxin system AbiEi family antitoxin domain-containing protein [Salipiger mucosus]|nr:hypothetical protein [Salipiger mucosus]
MGPQMRRGIELMSDGQVYSARELEDMGISRRVMRRLREGGHIHSMVRGHYFVDEIHAKSSVPAEIEEREYILEELAKACVLGGPEAAICLYSAAQWHDMSIDIGVPEVQVGVPHARGASRFENEPVQFIRWRQEESLEIGVETVASFKGVDVRMTNRERTLVDLLRYSPLNGGNDQTLMIDEESVTEAVSMYFGQEGSSPAKLISMAAKFGQAEQFDLIIKSRQKNFGFTDQEQPAAFCP